MRSIYLNAALCATFSFYTLTGAKHGNAHLNALERRHHHHRHEHASRAELGAPVELREAAHEKRTGQCEWPSDAGLVAVTPNDQNGGWAMSPDQCCKPGMYCPYACPPGQVMAQWDPDATYTYPQSMNGGLYCDKSGKVTKPFPDKPYCVNGTKAVGCKNEARGNVAFCQTVLPGNEAMLIPTDVESFAELAVPDPSYWAGTAAHFYINPPGKSTKEACVWGSSSNPWGNWSPYVAGANTDTNGQTFVKLGWNPIYLEPATPFRDKMPTWGVKVVCDGGECNGLPCAIDPSKHKVNEMDGCSSDGAGGAAFCVVTVPKGATANLVVFEGGSTGGSGSGSSDKQEEKPSHMPNPYPSPSPWPSPTPTPTPLPNRIPSPSPSSSSSPSSTPEPRSSTSTSTPESSMLASSSSSETPTIPPKSTSQALRNSSALETSTKIPAFSSSVQAYRTSASLSSTHLSFSYKPHVFVENGTATGALTTASSSGTDVLSTSASIVLQTAIPTGGAVASTQAWSVAFVLPLLAAVAVFAL